MVLEPRSQWAHISYRHYTLLPRNQFVLNQPALFEADEGAVAENDMV